MTKSNEEIEQDIINMFAERKAYNIDDVWVYREANDLIYDDVNYLYRGLLLDGFIAWADHSKYGIIITAKGLSAHKIGIIAYRKQEEDRLKPVPTVSNTVVNHGSIGGSVNNASHLTDSHLLSHVSTIDDTVKNNTNSGKEKEINSPFKISKEIKDIAIKVIVGLIVAAIASQYTQILQIFGIN